MMKCKITGVTVCAIMLWMAGPRAVAQEVPSAESYAVNFDRSTERTRTDRVLTRIALEGATLSLAQPRLMYNDMTSKQFVVQAGQTVKPSFGFSGSWMQGYVYIDKNRNGQFDVEAPGERGALTEENELVTFAGMNLPDGRYNSAGQALGDLSGVQPPAFTIPRSLEPGTYVMRWKVDWDSADPGGSMKQGNDIISNGGAIVDVLLRVLAEEDAEAYELVFSDEFDQPDGSAPDPSKWTSSARQRATWNRWVSDVPEVAHIKDGALLCRAIPNPDTSEDGAAMLTGAQETRGKFSFTYGKVEVRLKTNLHAGNFPAAWMMPQPPADGWPRGGEIDIFESIDAQPTAYHTVHSHWTYDLGHRSEPTSSFNEQVSVEQWHVYGLEWFEDLIVWTVDGKIVGTYAKSTDAAALENGQWPFDHPFYLILNQSVGDGSWAKAADTSFTYDTYFDYVRVYSRRAVRVEDVPFRHLGATGADRGYYDMGGRRLSQPRHGLFVQQGRKWVR